MLTANHSPDVARFITALTSALEIGDRQMYCREAAYGRLFINFYNVPLPYRGSSAEGENNRLMLDIVGIQSQAGRIRVELSVRGPSFGNDFKLRAKTTSFDGAIRYIAELLNRAAKKAPYGFTFDR